MTNSATISNILSPSIPDKQRQDQQPSFSQEDSAKTRGIMQNIHRNNDQKPIRKQWALNFREKCELLEKTAEVGIHFSVLDALLILALV